MRKIKYDFRKMRPRSEIGQIYKSAGIDFEAMRVRNIQQIFANEKTIEQIKKILTRGASRKYRWMSERKLASSVAFAMLDLAPVQDNSIPDNELWIYGEDEYLQALEDLRKRSR